MTITAVVVVEHRLSIGSLPVAAVAAGGNSEHLGTPNSRLCRHRFVWNTSVLVRWFPCVGAVFPLRPRRSSDRSGNQYLAQESRTGQI